MSSSSRLVSHPDRLLSKHLDECDQISTRALRRKYFSEEFSSNDELEQQRKLLIFFHDFGKASVYFQHKILKAVEKENPNFRNLDNGYKDDFYKIHPAREIEQELGGDSRLGNHASLGAFVLFALKVSEDVIDQVLLWEIIKRHHGDLQDLTLDELKIDEDELMMYSRQFQQTDKADYERILTGVNLKLPADIDHELRLFKAGLVLMELKQCLPTKDIKAYIKGLFLFSILLAADKGDMMLSYRQGVGEVLLLQKELIEKYKLHSFSNSSIKPIDLLRDEAYQLAESNVYLYPDEAFYSVTLPTGLGKTLTTYNAAIHLQNILNADYQEKGEPATPRLIYCLPFTSVIDQNAEILGEILRIGGMEDGYLAQHHYLSDWPTQKDEERELSDSDREYFTEGWEYPITVTTFVQLLETIFSNKNRRLRKFHNLANAVVILDEVQNIPPKYFESVEAVFSALHRYFNTRFILVTATQPILISKSKVIELTESPDGTRTTKSFFQGMDRIELDTSLWLNGGLPLDNLLEIFQEDVSLHPSKSFLFIFNTVKESQTAFKFFKENNPNTTCTYLSAAVLPVLRKERIQQVKSNKEAGQQIVVSTQVIEAGVDIDLDIVYRAFAPLDSINQSAGRCNRNGTGGKGIVKLFKTDKKHQIYPTELLNITEIVLRKFVSLENPVIKESLFYDLNEYYATEVRTSIADNSSASKIIQSMRELKYKEVNDDFQLITKQHFRYDVFIDMSDASAQVWSEFLEVKKIKDRWERKKAMRKLRPRLLQYVVQFPEKSLPPEYSQEKDTLIYLGPSEYPDYYSLETGYLDYSAPSNNAVSI